MDEKIRSIDIYKTTDLGKFKAFKGQPEKRADRNMKALALEMIDTKTNIVPIIVTQDFEVIDGNTRLAVCKDMEYPISYQKISVEDKEEALSMMRTLNASSIPWKIEEYVSFYANGMGYEVYKELHKRLSDTQFNITVFSAFEPSTFDPKRLRLGETKSYHNKTPVKFDKLDGMLETLNRLVEAIKKSNTKMPKMHLLARVILRESKKYGYKADNFVNTIDLRWLESYHTFSELEQNKMDELTLIRIIDKCMERDKSQ